MLPAASGSLDLLRSEFLLYEDSGDAPDMQWCSDFRFMVQEVQRIQADIEEDLDAKEREWWATAAVNFGKFKEFALEEGVVSQSFLRHSSRKHTTQRVETRRIEKLLLPTLFVGLSNDERHREAEIAVRKALERIQEIAQSWVSE